MQLDWPVIEAIGKAMYRSGRVEDEVFYLDAQTKAVTKVPNDDDEDNFFPIPAIEPVEEFHWMSDFSEMVACPETYEAMREALDVSRAMEKFRSILERNPEELEMWQIFMSSRKSEEALVWLEDVGLHAEVVN